MRRTCPAKFSTHWTGIVYKYLKFSRRKETFECERLKLWSDRIWNVGPKSPPMRFVTNGRSWPFQWRSFSWYLFSGCPHDLFVSVDQSQIAIVKTDSLVTNDINGVRSVIHSATFDPNILISSVNRTNLQFNNVAVSFRRPSLWLPPIYLYFFFG